MTTEFRTTDLYLAAFLRYRGVPCTAIEKKERGRSTFVFSPGDDPVDFEKIEREFYNDPTLTGYTSALVAMKARLHNG